MAWLPDQDCPGLGTFDDVFLAFALAKEQDLSTNVDSGTESCISVAGNKRRFTDLSGDPPVSE